MSSRVLAEILVEFAPTTIFYSAEMFDFFEVHHVPFQRILSMKMTEVWHCLDDFKRDGEENHDHTELIINQSQQRLEKHRERQEYLNKSTELLIERFSADLDRLEECSPTTSDLTSFPLSDKGNVALDFWGRTCYLNEVWGATRSLFHLQRIEGGKNCAEWHALLAKIVSLRHAASSQWLIDPGHDSEDLFNKVLQHLDTILSNTQSKESDKAKQSPLNLNTSFLREHDSMNEEAYVEDLDSTKLQGVQEHTFDSFLTLEAEDAASTETQNAQPFTGFPSGYESPQESESTSTHFCKVSSPHKGHRLDYLFDSAGENPLTKAPMQSYSMKFVYNCNELSEHNANRDSLSNVTEGANPFISPIKMGTLPQFQKTQDEMVDVTFVSVSTDDRKGSAVSRVSSQEDALDHSDNDLRVFPQATSSDTMTARANLGLSHDSSSEAAEKASPLLLPKLTVVSTYSQNAHYLVNARNIEPRRHGIYALSLLLFFTAFCSAYTWTNLSVADFEGAKDEATQFSRNEEPFLEPGLLTSHTFSDYRYRQWQSDIRMLQDITVGEILIGKSQFENEDLQAADFTSASVYIEYLSLRRASATYHNDLLGSSIFLQIQSMDLNSYNRRDLRKSSSSFHPPRMIASLHLPSPSLTLGNFSACALPTRYSWYGSPLGSFGPTKLVSTSALLSRSFILLRPKNKIIYEPKVKYHVGDKPPPRISNSLLGWLPPLFRTKEPELVDKLGLDAVTFLRFGRLMRGSSLASLSSHVHREMLSEAFEGLYCLGEGPPPHLPVRTSIPDGSDDDHTSVVSSFKTSAKRLLNLPTHITSILSASKSLDSSRYPLITFIDAIYDVPSEQNDIRSSQVMERRRIDSKGSGDMDVDNNASSKFRRRHISFDSEPLKPIMTSSARLRGMTAPNADEDPWARSLNHGVEPLPSILLQLYLIPEFD
ncbi:hypothetical protein C8J55DRAFT_567803 [Lentinula edodes]|uniref:CSC1/OSCA1-like N-terminal transmembrane domain-containing protein n=1 Tax=Lentinula lateritia TaxID=40482 RepID=A0A9W8ZNQ4_9AGAR|nr:hypothetical protein C8J55DRAFT_567803 [Lentinula edodes]